MGGSQCCDVIVVAAAVWLWVLWCNSNSTSVLFGVLGWRGSRAATVAMMCWCHCGGGDDCFMAAVCRRCGQVAEIDANKYYWCHHQKFKFWKLWIYAAKLINLFMLMSMKNYFELSKPTKLATKIYVCVELWNDANKQNSKFNRQTALPIWTDKLNLNSKFKFEQTKLVIVHPEVN